MTNTSKRVLRGFFENGSGQKLEFSNLQKSYLTEDGKLEFYDGLEEVIVYDTLVDFIAHRLNNKPSNYTRRICAGVRAVSGEVVFNKGINMCVNYIDNSFSYLNAVYSLPIRYCKEKMFYSVELTIADTDEVSNFSFSSHREIALKGFGFLRDAAFIYEHFNMARYLVAGGMLDGTYQLNEDFYLDIKKTTMMGDVA
jgi:hypothetical protein